MAIEKDIFAPIRSRRKQNLFEKNNVAIPDNKLFIRPLHKEDGQLFGVEFVQNGDFFLRARAYGNDIDDAIRNAIAGVFDVSEKINKQLEELKNNRD